AKQHGWRIRAPCEGVGDERRRAQADARRLPVADRTAESDRKAFRPAQNPPPAPAPARGPARSLDCSLESFPNAGGRTMSFMMKSHAARPVPREALQRLRRFLSIPIARPLVRDAKLVIHVKCRGFRSVQPRPPQLDVSRRADHYGAARRPSRRVNT